MTTYVLKEPEKYQAWRWLGMSGDQKSPLSLPDWVFLAALRGQISQPPGLPSDTLFVGEDLDGVPISANRGDWIVMSPIGEINKLTDDEFCEQFDLAPKRAAKRSK